MKLLDKMLTAARKKVEVLSVVGFIELDEDSGKYIARLDLCGCTNGIAQIVSVHDTPEEAGESINEMLEKYPPRCEPLPIFEGEWLLEDDTPSQKDHVFIEQCDGA